MSSLIVVLTAGCIFLNLRPIYADDDCPGKMPLKIGKNCYRFQTDIMSFKDASDNCRRLEKGGVLTTYKTQAVLDELKKKVDDIVLSKLKDSGLFWIGIKMEDTSMSKAAEDRSWTVDYDESKFVQKEYEYWDTKGGPKEKGLTCAAVNGSNDWKVTAVDCGGPRLGFVCMMKEGERCRHDMLPYLAYGKHCIAVLGGSEYNKLHGACNPNQPTPYQNEDHKMAAILAFKNSFLHGGIFMNIRKIKDEFKDLSDGSVPTEDMWEDGEPREEYECAGLSIQKDNTLKLKTISCEFKAFSLCSVNRTYERTQR